MSTLDNISRFKYDEKPSELTRILAIILESKGGVGKSVLSQTVVAALSQDGKRVFVAETDTTNSTMNMIVGDSAQLIDTSRTEAEGYFAEIGERLINKEFDNGVIDCGARDEASIRPYLKDLAADLRRGGAHLVILRPLVLSHFVQMNVYSFVKEYKDDSMGVVLVRNLSQGRRLADFDEWRGRKTTAEMLAAGCVVCDFADAGVAHSDNVTSFGMSLADAAMGRFEKAGEHRQLAEQLIGRPVQLFLTKWMYRQTESLRSAIAEAVGKCR